MNKIKLSILTSILIALSMNSYSAPKLYGNINIAADDQNGIHDYISNASRLGVKGEIGLENGLIGIYKIEYQIDPVDGYAQDEKRDSDGNITKSRMIATKRNSLIGIKGNWGLVKIGFHDTYLKLSQDKVDLFNDLRGDMKNAFSGENRTSDFIGYESPVFGRGFQIKYNFSDGGSVDNGGIGNRDSNSYALSYKTEKFYASYASEDNSSKSSGEDHTRIVIQVPIGKFKIGLIDQESELGSSKDDSTLISISWKATDKFTAKFQTMDRKDENGIIQDDITSLGLDYELSNKLKLFFYSTEHEDGVITISNQPEDYTGVGIEVKF